MFWVIAAVVIVVLFALAWWSSGRARPGRDIQRGVDSGGAEGKSRSQVSQTGAHLP
jgi:hypothetical protein